MFDETLVLQARMMLHTVNRNPSQREVRKFGATILIGLSVIGAFVWWLTADEATGLSWTGRGAQWAAAAMGLIGVLVGAICFASHGAGKPIYVVWMTAAMWIGLVMVPVFLTVVYFVVLLPFTLIRLSDPLRMKLKKEGSYWERHPPFEASVERMSRLF